MRRWPTGLIAKLQRIWQLVLLFAVLRIVVGVALIAIFDRGAVAWGIEATLIVAAAAITCLLVGLAVRRWAPPHRTS